MAENQILKRNLLALSSRDSNLSAQISAIKECRDNTISFIKSRSNHLVPVKTVDNRTFPLHSQFDPIKEGKRYLESSPDTGYLVFLGMGAGYHIEPFIKTNNVSNILIIEKNLCMVKTILEHIDMRSILMDLRVKILIDTGHKEVRETLLAYYLPALAGNLKTISLQARINTEREYFSDIVDTIKNVISQIADDYTVQSQFGKKWFVNTLANLSKAGDSTLTLKPVNKVLITGAGPSLDGQIKKLKSLRNESYLIASDTSLPSLLKHDIKPDLVISIDCQQVTYHHFLCGYPKEIPLVLDLASPPVLTRLTDKIIFFSSCHPFSQYVTNHWRQFPTIDTSGGNVSHAALSLANLLGAKEILLFGIDFSYPQGKSYVRGTYIYQYFRSLETRIKPLEAQFFSFLLRNKDMIKEKTGETFRYTTRPMINYKERIEKAISNMTAKIIPVHGHGIPIVIKQPYIEVTPSIPHTNHMKTIVSQGICKTNWKNFLKSYLKEIKTLPEPVSPLSLYFERLSSQDRALWMTQLPAATAIRERATGKPEKSHNENMLAIELLKKARAWTISIIKRALTS